MGVREDNPCLRRSGDLSANLNHEVDGNVDHLSLSKSPIARGRCSDRLFRSSEKVLADYAEMPDRARTLSDALGVLEAASEGSSPSPLFLHRPTRPIHQRGGGGERSVTAVKSSRYRRNGCPRILQWRRFCATRRRIKHGALARFVPGNGSYDVAEQIQLDRLRDIIGTEQPRREPSFEHPAPDTSV
jgi:hypothetical protein